MSPEKNEILTSNTETNTLSSLEKIKALKAEKELERQAKADQQKIEEENGEKAVSSSYNSEKEGLSGLQNRKVEVENRLNEIKSERGNIISSGHEAREEAEKDEDVKEIIHSKEGFNDVFAGEKKEWGNLREEVTALNQELKELEAALLVKEPQVKEIFAKTKEGKEEISLKEKQEKDEKRNEIIKEYVVENKNYTNQVRNGNLSEGPQTFIKFAKLARLSDEERKEVMDVLKENYSDEITNFFDTEAKQETEAFESSQYGKDPKMFSDHLATRKKRKNNSLDLVASEMDIVSLEAEAIHNGKDIKSILKEANEIKENKSRAERVLENFSNFKKEYGNRMNEAVSFDSGISGNNVNGPKFISDMKKVDDLELKINQSKNQRTKNELELSDLRGKKLGVFDSKAKHQERVSNTEAEREGIRGKLIELNNESYTLITGERKFIEFWTENDKFGLDLRKNSDLKSGMTLAEVALNMETYLLQVKEKELAPYDAELKDKYLESRNKVNEAEHLIRRN